MTALGFIETKGLLAAIEGADAMLKTAEVRLLEKSLIGGGLVTVTVAGEVSAVRVAVDAGVSAIRRIPGAVLVSEHVIARPDTGLAHILPPLPHTGTAGHAAHGCDRQLLDGYVGYTIGPQPEAVSPMQAQGLTEELRAEGGIKPAHPSPAPEASPSVEPASVEHAHYEFAQLKKMSVGRLRQIARSLNGIALTKDAINMGVKKDLLEAIIHAYRQIEE